MATSIQDASKQDASKQDASKQENMKHSSDDCNMAAFKQAASIQDASTQDSKDTQQPQSKGFLDLSPELRNRIYELVFSGITIHLDGSSTNLQNVYRLRISTCTTPSVDYLATEDLTGTSHDNLPGTKGTKAIKTHYTEEEEEICDSNQIFACNHICRKRVQLSTQLLRVNREIYSEAALIPYATNAFVFSAGFTFRFRGAFEQQFTDAQRRAIRTAIVPAAFKGQLMMVSGVVPKVKHIWLEGPAPEREGEGEDEDWDSDSEIMKRVESILSRE